MTKSETHSKAQEQLSLLDDEEANLYKVLNDYGKGENGISLKDVDGAFKAVRSRLKYLRKLSKELRD